jgi:hypothetical protein
MIKGRDKINKENSPKDVPKAAAPTAKKKQEKQQPGKIADYIALRAN